MENSLVKENFDNIKPNIFKTTSYPLIVEAKNIPELYNIQDIKPYNGYSLYDVDNYPNIALAPQVIGCGSRRQPCYGGSQQSINNILPPLEISEKNIAPSTIKIGPIKNEKLIGSLYKIFSNDNIILPLYMKTKNKIYNRYYYFTIIDNKKVKVFNPNIFQSFGTNDQVKIKGYNEKYRVTINEDRIPEYPRVE